MNGPRFVGVAVLLATLAADVSADTRWTTGATGRGTARWTVEGDGINIKVPAGTWHSLRADFAGDEFRVTFNGAELFRVRDGTLRDPDRVGVWSKADSVTEFAEFRAGD